MSQRGFTIVELLVTIIIIAVFIAVIVSNFTQIKLQFALSRVSYKFAQDLRKAQNFALTSLEYKDSSGNIKSVDGYGVYIDFDNLGNKKYIIYADIIGNQQYDIYNALDNFLDVIDFTLTEPGIIIKQIDNVSGNKVSINFNSSNLNTKITQLNQGQNNVNIVFALESDLTKTKTVSVNTSGLIEVK